MMSDSSDNEAAGSLKRIDSSESITNKCHHWNLGNTSKCEQPTSESIGIARFDRGSINKENMSTNANIIQENEPLIELWSLDDEDNEDGQQVASTIHETCKQDDDFFVFKRRRLDIIAGEDKINNLCDEHLLKIFSFLSKETLTRCAQVCRRWKNICFDESLWKRLDLSSKVLQPGSVGRVLLRGVRVLRLTKAEICVPIFCPPLEKYPIDFTARMRYLDLSMASVRPEGIEEILKFCTRLVKVSLEHCTLTPMAMMYLANRQELEAVNLAMTYNITADGVVNILAHCRRLESLNISWISLTSPDLTKITHCDITPTLRFLNISGCRESLFDTHMKALAYRCHDLLQLDVSDAMKLTSYTMNVMPRYFPKLHHLASSRCYGIHPEAYTELRHFRDLKYLDVFGIFNDDSLEALRSTLPRIKINTNIFSTIARPTCGFRRSSMWNQRVRD